VPHAGDLAQLGGEQPRHAVHRPAGREGHDDRAAFRPDRLRARERRRGQAGKQGSTQHRGLLGGGAAGCHRPKRYGRMVTMVYELRIYRCVPGRLPDLLSRFRNHTLKLWDKHGIRQAGFWTTVAGPSSQDLHYLLAWESLAEREAKWAVFATDPEWLAVRAQTEANGQIVANVENLFLAPTDFSSVQ